MDDFDLAEDMRGGDFGVGTDAGEVGPVLTLESEAAVGRLRRSIASLLIAVFLMEGGGGSGAFRAFAREAAVGANKPLEGVFERGVKVGVFVPVAVRVGVLAMVEEKFLLEVDETID
jgi:hypothetical protein